jgi:hypothetical protein
MSACRKRSFFTINVSTLKVGVLLTCIHTYCIRDFYEIICRDYHDAVKMHMRILEADTTFHSVVPKDEEYRVYLAKLPRDEQR